MLSLINNNGLRIKYCFTNFYFENFKQNLYKRGAATPFTFGATAPVNIQELYSNSICFSYALEL